MYKSFEDDGTYDITLVNKGIVRFNQKRQTRVNVKMPISVLRQIKTAYLLGEEHGNALLSHIIDVLENTNDFESEIKDSPIANTIWKENCREPLKAETRTYWLQIGASAMGGENSAKSRNGH